MARKRSAVKRAMLRWCIYLRDYAELPATSRVQWQVCKHIRLTRSVLQTETDLLPDTSACPTP